MKKAAYISVTILEILCLAGAWAIQYFTRRKMGMARYVVYKNRSWEARYPMELLANGAVLLMVVLTVMLLLYFLRQRRNLTKTVWLMNAGMIALTSAYGGFTWMNSADEVRAYYCDTGGRVPDSGCEDVDWNVGVQAWPAGNGMKRRVRNRG